MENAPDETAVKCSDCGTIFTKAELIHDNSERIEMAVEEVKTEAIKEIEKTEPSVDDLLGTRGEE